MHFIRGIRRVPASEQAIALPISGLNRSLPAAGLARNYDIFQIIIGFFKQGARGLKNNLLAVASRDLTFFSVPQFHIGGTVLVLMVDARHGGSWKIGWLRRCFDNELTPQGCLQPLPLAQHPGGRHDPDVVHLVEACRDHRQGYDQAAEREELALPGLAADGVVYSCSA
jgi:hypothetical protein